MLSIVFCTCKILVPITHISVPRKYLSMYCIMIISQLEYLPLSQVLLSFCYGYDCLTLYNFYILIYCFDLLQADQSENLPSQICYNCLQELESAYKFRRKCQKADKQFRSAENKIKLEYQIPVNQDDTTFIMGDDMDRTDFEIDTNDKDITISKKQIISAVKKEKPMKRRRNIRKSRYDYWKICEICGKNTKNLISHLDAHNIEKKYSCDICDKKFKFKSGLIIHKAIHNPTPRKTCEVCGKTFHILAQYRKHFVYHANERKFECETCGKRFNTLDILRVHNMTHTDERPFTCSECGKTFRTAGCVGRHKKIVHRSVKKSQ